MGTLNMGRRIPLIALAAMIGIALLLVTLLSLSSLAFSAEASSHILCVAPDGDCGGQVPCYNNIQEAVVDADTADEIRVSEGIYTETNNLGGLAQV